MPSRIGLPTPLPRISLFSISQPVEAVSTPIPLPAAQAMMLPRTTPLVPLSKRRLSPVPLATVVPAPQSVVAAALKPAKFCSMMAPLTAPTWMLAEVELLGALPKPRTDRPRTWSLADWRSRP